MKITIYLNNNMQFTADVEEYNASDFTSKMNSPQIVMINIGDIVINKNNIMMVIPSDILPTK